MNKDYIISLRIACFVSMFCCNDFMLYKQFMFEHRKSFDKKNKKTYNEDV